MPRFDSAQLSGSAPLARVLFTQRRQTSRSFPPAVKQSSAPARLNLNPNRRQNDGADCRKKLLHPENHFPIFRLRFAGAGKFWLHFHVPGEDVIRLEGTVLEVLREQKLFRVGLANGHRLLGHVSARRREEAAGLKPGDRVNLVMSPFDFSKGRIVLEERQK